MSYNIESITWMDGGFVPFHSSHTSWLRPRTFVYDSCFKEFIVPSLTEFLDGDRDEILVYPIRAIKRYLTGLSSSDLNAVVCSSRQLGAGDGRPETSFWFRLVISHACQSATDDCKVVKVQGSWNAKDRYFTSLQKELCSPSGAEGWYLVIASNLLILVLTTCPHSYMDTFSIALW